MTVNVSVVCKRYIPNTFFWWVGLQSFVTDSPESAVVHQHILSNLLFLQGFTDHVLATILTARDKYYTLPQTAPSRSSCPHTPLCHLHKGRPVASANLHTSESLQVCLSTPQVLRCNYLTAYCLPHLPGLSVQENSWSLPSDKRTNLIPCWTPYAPLDAFGGSSNIAAL